MALWVVAHQHQLAAVKAMTADITRQDEQITIHMTKKESMEAERAALEARQRLIEQLEDKASLVVVFSDISRRLPETVVLTELSVECPLLSQYAVAEEPAAPPAGRAPSPVEPGPKPWMRNDRPSAGQITMNGIARDIPEVIEFAAALENSPLFDRVQREMTKEKTVWAGCLVQRFKLTCALVRQVGVAP